MQITLAERITMYIKTLSKESSTQKTARHLWRLEEAWER